MSTATNTDVFVDCDQAAEAPDELPSYKDLAPVQNTHSGSLRQDVKVDVKANVEVDDDESWPSATPSQPSSSSTQLFAPSQGLRVTDSPRDAAEARKIDFETWPRGPRLRTDAVYGLYLKADNLYGKGSNGGVTSLKITDYHGGVLYHLRFASNGVPKGAMECVHMVPGDETRTTPCSSWRLPMMIPTVLRVSGAFPKSRSPALPSNWTWRQDYDYKHRVESIDGRLSRMSCSLNQQERQVLTKDCLPMHRDWFAFTVPVKKGEKNERTFVWLASGIMRNKGCQRWDQGQYVLHEKGDLTKVYGTFSWRRDFCIEFRELPKELEREHPLILYMLLSLILSQLRGGAKWAPASYEESGFSKDPTRLSFNVAALQKRAADLLGPRHVPAPQ